MDLKYLLILIAINMVFLFVGGIIFHAIERPAEERASEDSEITYDKLKEALLEDITCLNETQLDTLIRTVVSEYEKGHILVEDNAYWDIPGSIFFASTVITTIGYGHITLATSGGRVFCIFYALLGIPLCLIMLGEIGMRFSRLGQKLDARVNKGFFPKLGKYIRPTMIFITGFALFILIPALILAIVEDWNYGTAVYYSVITLTTVGFGDVVAGHNSDKDYSWMYIIGLSFWILVGLAWVANMIANCQEIYKGVGEEIGDIVDSDEESDTKDQPVSASTQFNQTDMKADLTKVNKDVEGNPETERFMGT